MSFYKEVPGRQKTLESALKFDTEPKASSTNPVTSDGVATAITEAVGGASDALQEQIDDIAEKAGSGYTPKGPASVATLNGLTGQENGWLYTITDAGTLTDGSLAVVAGEQVAWDEANSVWYKAMDYAPRQYGTNEVHNLPTTITAFRTGDVIPVDGPSGTAKMGKDSLLAITAENTLSKNIAPAFDPSKANGGDGFAYHSGEKVSYNGETYRFVSNKATGAWDSSYVSKIASVDLDNFSENFYGLSAIDLNDSSIWEQGGIDTSSGADVAYTNRLRTKSFYKIIDGATGQRNPNKTTNISAYAYDIDGNYIGNFNPNVADAFFTYVSNHQDAVKFKLSIVCSLTVVPSDLPDLFVFKKVTWLLGNSYLNFALDDISTKEKLLSFSDINMNDSSLWEQGGIDTSSGAGVAYTNRLRTKEFYTFVGDVLGTRNPDKTTNISAYAYDIDGNYIGLFNPNVKNAIYAYVVSKPKSFKFKLSIVCSLTVVPSDLPDLFVFSANAWIMGDNYIKALFKQVSDNENYKGYYFNVLTGKKWVACGDSFTHGDFSGGDSSGDTTLQDGMYKGQLAVYPFVIGNRTHCNVQNIAVNGMTLAQNESSTSSDCFTYPVTGKLYTSIPADADYITLYFGINDGHNGIPVGSPSDNTNTTFYGALNVALEYLVTNYPKAHIGVIASNGCDADGYPQAAVDAAKKWGVHYLDLDGAVGCRTMLRCRRSPASSSIKATILSQQKVNNSNSHPNVMAHSLESTFIEAWLKSL